MAEDYKRKALEQMSNEELLALRDKFRKGKALERMSNEELLRLRDSFRAEPSATAIGMQPTAEEEVGVSPFMVPFSDIRKPSVPEIEVGAEPTLREAPSPEPAMIGAAPTDVPITAPSAVLSAVGAVSMPPQSPRTQAEEFLDALVSGGIRGFTGLDVDSKDLKENFGFDVGELAGFLGSYALATRYIRPLVGGLSKLAPAARRIVAETIAGGAVETGHQTLRRLAGQDTDPIQIPITAATFGAIGGTLETLGFVGKKIAGKTVEIRKWVPTGPPAAWHKPADQFVNRTRWAVPINKPDGTVEFVYRKAPGITPTERQAVESMPILPERKITKGALPLSIETSLRTFDRLGEMSKELFSYPMRGAEHRFMLRTRNLDKTIKALSKKYFTRGSADRIGLYGISREHGGIEILSSMGKKVPKLTEGESHVYEWMRRGYDRTFTELNAARESAGLDLIPKVENYFTFVRLLDDAQKAGLSPLESAWKDIRRFIKVSATPFQFGRKRLGGILPVKTNAVDVFKQYHRSALRHIELSPEIAKQRQLISGNYFDGFDLSVHNPEAYNFLHQWLTNAAGVPSFPTAADPVLRWLNKNLTFSILSANIRSAAIQPSAIVNTAAEIGPLWAARGVKQLLSPKGRRFALKESNVLLGRQYDVAVDEMVGAVTGTIKKKVGTAGLSVLRVLDMETAQATWLGAYSRGQKVLKMSHRNAVNYADNTVVRTQASASPLERAPIQRSALGQSATLFQTFVINNWGFLTRDVIGIGRRSPFSRETAKKVTTWVAGATILNTIYEDVLGWPSPFPSPLNAFAKQMEYSDDPTAASWRALREMSELMPIVGGAVRYGSHPFGAQVDVWGDITANITSGWRSKRSLPENLARIAGVPGVAQAAKTIRMLEGE